MGQCMSRKAAGAFAASAAAAHNRPASKMHKHHQLKDSPDDERQPPTKKPGAGGGGATKGVSMSFGFRRRPTTAPAIAGNAAAARRLADIDRNGNNNTNNRNNNSDYGEDGHSERELLTSNAAPTGRTTPRLAPPKKEANATTRVSRFGFRQPQANRLSKVADLNATQKAPEFAPNRHDGDGGPKIKVTTGTVIIDSNRQRPAVKSQVQAGRFTLQQNHLPRPQQPIRVMESKAAKTLANHSKKYSAALGGYADLSDGHSSSKEGSVTEDSGVGSNSGGNFETDTLHGVELLEGSPRHGFGKAANPKPRNLEVLVSGKTFDVRDLEDGGDPAVALPSLPSAFATSTPEKPRSGYVRERALDYQRMIVPRKISVTSSEGFSDDYCDEEKTRADSGRNEKNRTFVKARPAAAKDDSSSPTSSDEWAAGEAMADELSCSLSSSDESKEPERRDATLIVAQASIGAALKNLVNATVVARPEMRTVLLTIEDPKFAAVAASSGDGILLEDETSPVDSLLCSCSESNDTFCKPRPPDRSSSDSKDVNERPTVATSTNNSSPGTPTNADNSLSLSDGRDYFDDEIADQPALVFDDTLNAGGAGNSESYQISDTTLTLVESTPKVRRKHPGGSADASPLPSRSRRFLSSRTGSVDTLSPCESIASDDLMMDFEYSQSSGVDETMERSEHHAGSFLSLQDQKGRCELDAKKRHDVLRDWSVLMGAYNESGSPKSVTRSARLLRSRAGTPNSVPDSPRSLDGGRTTTNSNSNHAIKPRTSSIAHSPLRSSKTGSLTSSAGYESDDSVKFERSNHGAMVQDIMSIKTMLLKLKRVLHESETHNPFDSQHSLANGLFNGLNSGGAHLDNNAATAAAVNADSSSPSSAGNAKIELADLRRQVLFLQGQLEDKDNIVKSLREQMGKMTADQTNKSASGSSIVAETCNAATQTERLRPISAGPALLQATGADAGAGSLVSANNESPARKSRTQTLVDHSATTNTNNNNNNNKKPTSRLWRKPGEPPSPQRYSSTTTLLNSSIPRRANSRTRAPSTPS